MASGFSLTRQNKTTLLGLGLGLFVTIYLLHSWITSNEMPPKLKLQYKTVEIPNDVLTAAKKIQIKERYITLTVNEQELKVFVLSYTPPDSELSFIDRCSVLLLHGSKFSSKNWSDLGTLQLLGAMNCQVVAVDLPGYGKSDSNTLSDESRATFLTELIRAEKMATPIIISPSMSGMYSLPFLFHPNPVTCMKRALAYIPIAPAHTEKYTKEQFSQCEIPVLITYGEKDKSLGVKSLKKLRHMPHGRVIPVKNGGHAYYMENRAEWHKILYNFIQTLLHRTV